MKCKYFDICPVRDEKSSNCNDNSLDLDNPLINNPLRPIRKYGQTSCIPLLLEAYYTRGDQNGC